MTKQTEKKRAKDAPGPAEKKTGKEDNEKATPLKPAGKQPKEQKDEVFEPGIEG